MKRSLHKASPEKETSSSEYWELASSPPPCLRAVLSDGRSAIFPYIHLLQAIVRNEGSQEVLEAQFTAATLLIKGHHLGPLLISLQKFSVEVIRAAPTRFSPPGESPLSIELVPRQ